MEKNNVDSDKKQIIIKKAFNIVKNWLGLSFGLLTSVIVILLTQINKSLSNANQPTISIPWWIWIIIAAFFVLIGIIAILVIRISFEHHYIHHNENTNCSILLDRLHNECSGLSEKIENPVTAICNKCEQIQLENCENYSNTIDKINNKIEQQDVHISSVNQLIVNAQKLEKLYADAVSERLRTNKQVASIEAEAKRNTEIYIMTSSFLFERYDSDMRSAIVTNINKGVKYRYIIPIGSENDFEQMVYAILADENLYEKYREMSNNDFLTATKLRKEYFMLTIAYYELSSESLSEVIVKLPADTLNEVSLEKPLTYLVPKGIVENSRGRQHNSEHKIFLDNLRALYNIGKEENNEVLKLTADKLKELFPDGVEISTNPSKIIILK